MPPMFKLKTKFRIVTGIYMLLPLLIMVASRATTRKPFFPDLGILFPVQGGIDTGKRALSGSRHISKQLIFLIKALAFFIVDDRSPFINKV